MTTWKMTKIKIEANYNIKNTYNDIDDTFFDNHYVDWFRDPFFHAIFFFKKYNVKI